MAIFDLLILCIKKIYLLKSYIGMVADAFAKKLYFPILVAMLAYQLAVTPTLTRYYTIYVSPVIERLGQNPGKYDV